MAHFWQNLSCLFSLFAPVQDLWSRLAALRLGVEITIIKNKRGVDTHPRRLP
jgi:hypothetical protein